MTCTDTERSDALRLPCDGAPPQTPALALRGHMVAVLMWRVAGGVPRRPITLRAYPEPTRGAKAKRKRHGVSLGAPRRTRVRQSCPTDERPHPLSPTSACGCGESTPRLADWAPQSAAFERGRNPPVADRGRWVHQAHPRVIGRRTRRRGRLSKLSRLRTFRGQSRETMANNDDHQGRESITHEWRGSR